jgi:hypothetical protein
LIDSGGHGPPYDGGETRRTWSALRVPWRNVADMVRPTGASIHVGRAVPAGFCPRGGEPGGHARHERHRGRAMAPPPRRWRRRLVRAGASLEEPLWNQHVMWTARAGTSRGHVPGESNPRPPAASESSVQRPRVTEFQERTAACGIRARRCAELRSRPRGEQQPPRGFGNHPGDEHMPFHQYAREPRSPARPVLRPGSFKAYQMRVARAPGPAANGAPGEHTRTVLLTLEP